MSIDYTHQEIDMEWGGRMITQFCGGRSVVSEQKEMLNTEYTCKRFDWERKERVGLSIRVLFWFWFCFVLF